MDARILAEAALDCAAHLGEHFDDDNEIEFVIVSVVMRTTDGDLEPHTHYQFANQE